jgi:hypothetical protein
VILATVFLLVALFGNPHRTIHSPIPHPERFDLAPNPGVVDWLAEADYQLEDR